MNQADIIDELVTTLMPIDDLHQEGYLTDHEYKAVVWAMTNGFRRKSGRSELNAEQFEIFFQVLR